LVVAVVVQPLKIKIHGDMVRLAVLEAVAGILVEVGGLHQPQIRRNRLDTWEESLVACHMPTEVLVEEAEVLAVLARI